MVVRKFKVKNRIWLWPGGAAAWHFISIPPETTVEINKKYKNKKKGFGSLKVNVRIGKTKFSTSIFPHTKDGIYILPIKKQVRRMEGLQDGDVIDFELEIC